MMRGGIYITFKYTEPSEDKEIVEMYRSSMYSYQQIADIKCLSKGTVINIVKGYPYNKNTKDIRYFRLQVDSAENAKAAIKTEEEKARKAYERGNFTAYGSHMQRWLMLTKMLNESDGQLYENIKAVRTQYEQQAWNAFSEKDYAAFGYYADSWDTLTDILGDNAKNPWPIVAEKVNAKNKRHDVKYSNGNGLSQLREISHNGFMEISDESWKLIRPVFPRNSKGRKQTEQRKYFNGILYALCNLRSFRLLPEKYGSTSKIYRAFECWYRAGAFTDLLELVTVCPELEAVKQQLLTLQMYSLVNRDVVPRLNDVRRSVEEGRL